jgi:hypothetical protein
MSLNPPAIPKRLNALTSAMQAVEQANMEGGTALGSRGVGVPSFGDYIPPPPLSDDEKKARELEYFKETGAIVPGSELEKSGETAQSVAYVHTDPPTHAPVSQVVSVSNFVPMKFTPQQVALQQPIDFSDIHSIDFKNKTIVVAGTTIPLTEEFYLKLAEDAADALIASMISVGARAKNKLLPARSTDGEQVVSEVSNGETKEGIQ